MLVYSTGRATYIIAPVYCQSDASACMLIKAVLQKLYVTVHKNMH